MTLNRLCNNYEWKCFVYEIDRDNPDAKSSSWSDVWKAFPLNQEVARWLWFFPEWAGYDWEWKFYDAG